LYIDGNVTTEIYNKKTNELTSELEELSMQYSALTKTSIDLLRYSENLIELFKNSQELYFHLSNSEKRELLKLLCSNFYYDGENVTITTKKAFQPLVKIAFLKNLGAS
jgi:hypothetical protein